MNSLPVQSVRIRRADRHQHGRFSASLLLAALTHPGSASVATCWSAIIVAIRGVGHTAGNVLLGNWGIGQPANNSVVSAVKQLLTTNLHALELITLTTEAQNFLKELVVLQGGLICVL